MPRSTRKTPPAPPPRRRRDPAVARAEILDATERLLADAPPDAVGLKDVAAAAGVSHALVSHYFGTYGGLIESVLVRRIRTMREKTLARMAVPGALEDPGQLIDVLFAMIEDPLYLRVSLWAFASERGRGVGSLPVREQGMRIVAEAVTARIRADRPELPAGQLRERVELALCLANSSAYGYAVGKEVWLGALAREPSAKFDASVRRALSDMLRRFVLGE